MKRICCAVCCALFAVIFPCSPSPGASQDEQRYLDAITKQQPELVTIAGLELAGADAISLVDGANPYLGLRVYPDQPLVNNGKRAEISFDFPHSPGDTIVYEWKIMLPLLFPPSDVPDSRWWSISQWHDQPNINKGETWDNFPAHPPVIALEYENLNGQDYLGFYHGIFNTERVGLIPILRGQWLHLRAEIHWSQGEDGSVQLFLGDDKAPIFSARGANMSNDYPHYFKIGQYRDPAINSDNTVYFDDVRIYKKPGILLMALPAILGKPSARGNWWCPAPGTSWQWQLSGTVDTSIAAAMYDVDLHTTPQSTIDQLHRQGRMVICYLSAGSWEPFRDDASAYPQSVLGKTLDGWPDERWVDIRRMYLLGPILKARMGMAGSPGFAHLFRDKGLNKGRMKSTTPVSPQNWNVPLVVGVYV